MACGGDAGNSSSTHRRADPTFPFYIFLHRRCAVGHADSRKEACSIVLTLPSIGKGVMGYSPLAHQVNCLLQCGRPAATRTSEIPAPTCRRGAAMSRELCV